MIKITIDNRESIKRIQSAQKFFKNKNYDIIHVEQLKYGDYVISDGENEVCFEYKTIEDFIQSIKDNRVFNQAINMCENYNQHFVIIAGDYTKTSEKLYHLGINVSREMFDGAIARLNTITTVIQVKNENKAFETIHLQSNKSLDGKKMYKHEGRLGKGVGQYLTVTVDGVSDKTASLIESELKLNTLIDLMNITYDELISIKGIGKVTAENILSRIKKESDDLNRIYMVYALDMDGDYFDCYGIYNNRNLAKKEIKSLEKAIDDKIFEYRVFTIQNTPLWSEKGGTDILN